MQKLENHLERQTRGSSTVTSVLLVEKLHFVSWKTSKKCNNQNHAGGIFKYIQLDLTKKIISLGGGRQKAFPPHF